jgi:hypothetical protein
MKAKVFVSSSSQFLSMRGCLGRFVNEAIERRDSFEVRFVERRGTEPGYVPKSEHTRSRLEVHG